MHKRGDIFKKKESDGLYILARIEHYKRIGAISLDTGNMYGDYVVPEDIRNIHDSELDKIFMIKEEPEKSWKENWEYIGKINLVNKINKKLQKEI